MKAILLFLTFTVSFSFAQTGINYQGAATDADGAKIVDQNISLRTSVLQGGVDGTTSYSETHNTTTDQFGLFNVVIGQGEVVSGAFDSISWGADPHFLKVELDATGGSDYSLVSTTQMMSVPYALYAENAGLDSNAIDDLITNFQIDISTFGDTLTIGNQSVIIPGISQQNNSPIFGSLTDIDGNTYQTVLINGKEWMTENLYVSKYSDGTEIPHITSSIYNNYSYEPNCLNPRYVLIEDVTAQNITTAFYNAYAIQEDNICPTGWHVATLEDFVDVLNLFSMSSDWGGSYSNQWPSAGPALKSNNFWQLAFDVNNGIEGSQTNESNLSFLPANGPTCTYYDDYNPNTSFGNGTRIYTSTEASINGGNYSVYLEDKLDRVTIQENSPHHFYSVRCVKDY